MPGTERSDWLRAVTLGQDQNLSSQFFPVMSLGNRDYFLLAFVKLVEWVVLRELFIMSAPLYLGGRV